MTDIKQNKSLPFPVPLGGGRNRDLITPGGKGKGFLNIINKARLSDEDIMDITCANAIAGDDDGHREFVESFCVCTMAKYGLARSEHLQATVGVAVPSGLPKGYGVFDDDSERKPRIFRKIRRDDRRKEEDEDA